jgi:hypothetical protein
MLIALFWIGFLGAAAVVILVNHRRKLVPLTPIGDAPDAARVRIAGKVATENALRAPLSGRPCTCYQLWMVMRGLTRGTQRRTHRGAHEFQLTDPTGTASVPIERVYLEVSADHIETTTIPQLNDSIRSILERSGIKLQKVSSIQLYEAIIAHGDEIEVVGSGLRRAVPNGPRERGFRDAPASLLELRGPVLVIGARREIRTLQ